MTVVMAPGIALIRSISDIVSTAKGQVSGCAHDQADSCRTRKEETQRLRPYRHLHSNREKICRIQRPSDPPRRLEPGRTLLSLATSAGAVLALANVCRKARIVIVIGRISRIQASYRTDCA